MSYTKKELKYIEHHMKNAINAGSMSCSKKRKVGCVIVKNNRVIVNGWNGILPNQDNCCEELVIECSCGEVTLGNQQLVNYSSIAGTNTECPKCSKANKWRLRTRDDVVHAEENTILYAAKEGISIKGASVYTTTAPCIKCSRMLIGCGVTNVYYLFKYKHTDGIELLTEHNVKVKQLAAMSDHGYILTPEAVFNVFSCSIAI